VPAVPTHCWHGRAIGLDDVPVPGGPGGLKRQPAAGCADGLPPLPQPYTAQTCPAGRHQRPARDAARPTPAPTSSAVSGSGAPGAETAVQGWHARRARAPPTADLARASAALTAGVDEMAWTIGADVETARPARSTAHRLAAAWLHGGPAARRSSTDPAGTPARPATRIRHAIQLRRGQPAVVGRPRGWKDSTPSRYSPTFLGRAASWANGRPARGTVASVKVVPPVPLVPTCKHIR
jgi:hypothetical protein